MRLSFPLSTSQFCLLTTPNNYSIMAGTSLRGRDWLHFGLRIIFCASAIALLAVTARLATGWGGIYEEPPIVLPIVLATVSHTPF
jgi:hypothetical protein